MQVFPGWHLHAEKQHLVTELSLTLYLRGVLITACNSLSYIRHCGPWASLISQGEDLDTLTICGVNAENQSCGGSRFPSLVHSKHVIWVVLQFGFSAPALLCTLQQASFISQASLF